MAVQSLRFLLLIPFLSSLSFAWNPDDLPGWMGEMKRHHRVDETGSHNFAGGKSLLRGPDPIVVNPTKVIQLSWKPRAFLYKGLLSEEECDYIVNKARDKVTRSTVVGTLDGKSVQDEIRTSSGMFLNKYEDPVVDRIEERIAAWTFFPKENGEAIQVLRYNHNEKYGPHYDYFDDPKNKEMGGPRIATVLMYLSDVVKGGETAFPNSAEKPEKDDSWSECGKTGLAVKPAKGDALLFFSLKPDATFDQFSLHTGCPVVEGEKWSATKWIHTSNFDGPRKDPNKCVDENANCERWAEIGECEKNPMYMVGKGLNIGNCRKACKACNSHLLSTN